ncbi:MAG TPA: hypothetical protein DIT01_04955 [Lentisphaeria bacterium]|nr:hypothetical protein [Lentisphaeria bacterium]
MASACASEVVMVLCINYKRVTATLIDNMNTIVIAEIGQIRNQQTLCMDNSRSTDVGYSSVL